jgi:hypothetical protein
MDHHDNLKYQKSWYSVSKLVGHKLGDRICFQQRPKASFGAHPSSYQW